MHGIQTLKSYELEVSIVATANCFHKWMEKFVKAEQKKTTTQLPYSAALKSVHCIPNADSCALFSGNTLWMKGNTRLLLRKVLNFLLRYACVNPCALPDQS